MFTNLSPRRLNRLGRLGLAASLLVTMTLYALGSRPAYAASIIRVSPTGSTSWPCGADWTDPCALQTALANSESGDEIWAAAGVYIPHASDRTVSFALKSGVAIYGGFPGTGDPGMDNRNWQANPTFLSGDLLGNDVGFANNGENSYHVVVGSGTDSTAVLDGFTISGGNANDTSLHNSGGGMYNDGGSPTLANVTFSGNRAGDWGGGMYNSGGSPTLANVTFSGNRATDGGGMFNGTNSSPTLTNVIFSGNTAYGGGGMFNGTNSSPTLTNVTFSDNGVVDSGGGMFNYNGSSPTLTNVTFNGNRAALNGGGGMFNQGSSLTLARVTFRDNSTSNGAGGGMVNLGGSLTLTNVIFSGNTAAFGGGGMYNSVVIPMLTNVTFSGNTSTTSGGGMYNDGGNPTLTNIILWGNDAPIGPQIFNSGSTPTVSYSLVQGGCPAGASCGAGMIYADPLFVDAANGNLRLGLGSPAIDVGDDAAVTTLVDLDGKTRQVDGNCDGNAVVDPGAYEFAYHDFNASGLVDVQDIMQAAARWNDPGAYDPIYDVAPPFGSPIDILDIIAIVEQWNVLCQPESTTP